LIFDQDIEYVKNNIDKYKKELGKFIIEKAIDFETTIIDAYMNKR
jgi:hypothetical protein